MIFKEPLNIEVILQLLDEVIDNASEYILQVQNADKKYSNDVVEIENLKKILNAYKTKELLYANEVNEKQYYNFDEVLAFNLSNDMTVYDIIDLAIAVLLTQNRAVFYVDKINKSYSLDLVINLLKKLNQLLKLYDNYIDFEVKPKKNAKYHFVLIKKDDKIMYKRKHLEIEFDYNLLLKAYDK